MTPLTTVRAELPCPSCGSRGPRVLSWAAPAARTELPEAAPGACGAKEGAPGRVSACDACWQRRAELVATARRSLRATGELTSLGPGREDAWLGVPLSRCEEAFENAFASALLKAARGMPLPPPAYLAPLPATAEAPVEQRREPAPEPVGVG